MYNRTIICLANSYKHHGRCVAGKEFSEHRPGPWIRPVSGRPGHEIQEVELICTDRRPLEVLDIARVTLDRAALFQHQHPSSTVQRQKQRFLTHASSIGAAFRGEFPKSRVMARQAYFDLG